MDDVADVDGRQQPRDERPPARHQGPGDTHDQPGRERVERDLRADRDRDALRRPAEKGEEDRVAGGAEHLDRPRILDGGVTFRPGALKRPTLPQAAAKLEVERRVQRQHALRAKAVERHRHQPQKQGDQDDDDELPRGSSAPGPVAGLRRFHQ
jgi:hypothetical protein